MYLAGRAHEQGNAAEFDHLYKKAMDGLDRAYALAPRNVSVLAVTAGATSILTDRLPEDRRKEVFELSRARFQELMTLQAAQFDQMPPHHCGEVLTGLAQAEERLGNRAKSREYLTQIVETLAGTPYERAARGWLDNPGEGKLVCQSCHDAGRLANVMAQR